MVEKKTKNLLLLALLAVAFTYRFSLMMMNGFPPGADIGLHESVIKSITSGQTNLFYNYYHMGGEFSVTNPGYHIFTAFLINFTGLTDYVAQAVVASFFSAFLVLCAFLIVRKVASESAGFIVAVLVLFSYSDILIISWGGYPNTVTLALIPLVFYLFLQPSKLSSKSYLAAASILVSAIFLTHIFSALILVGITVFTLLMSAVFHRRTELSKRQVVSWILPIAFGALLVSPYIVNILPVYFSSQGTITGTVSITNQAVLNTRLIPIEIIGLSLIPVFLFFVFFKNKQGKLFSTNAILFASWMLVPVLATQSYLFNFYLDYERFLYFLALPAIICVGLLIVKSPNAISRAIQFLQDRGKLKTKLNPIFSSSKRALTVAWVAVLLVAVLFTPLFALPYVGASNSISEVNFFQVMNSREYQAIQWIKANTSVGSVCVADSEFGWWLSGFAQRPTLSAVDPQYLILKNEIEPARIAANLLTADYLVDNGLIQIEQDGVSANGSTHEIQAIVNSTFIPLPVFAINDTEISLLYRENGSPQQLTLTSLANSSTRVESNGDNATFIVTHENQSLKLTEQITIFRGVSFAKISLSLIAKTVGVQYDWLQLPFQAKGAPVLYGNSVAIVDGNLHELSQLEFPNGALGNDVVMQQNPDFYSLIFNLNGNNTAEVNFFVGLSQFSSNVDINQPSVVNSLIENNSQTYLQKSSNLPLTCFDYQQAIKDWNISYIAVRDSASLQRFTNDPSFTLVFQNEQVSIFKVNKA